MPDPTPAITALTRQGARLEAIGDPVAPMVSEFARLADALSSLATDTASQVAAQQDATAKLIADSRQPWTPEETRVLVRQLDRTLLHRWTQFNRAGIAIGVAVAVAFGTACGGAGWWYRGATPTLVGVRAGAERCEDRPDGSRLCWIPVFERLPAQTK